MSFLPHQRITDAIHAAESEIEIIESEQTTYRRFHRRLEELEAANRESVSTPNPTEIQTTAVEPVSVGKALREAREAYRETVMATDHYDAEYAESLREHIAAEFGSTVAAQFADGKTLTSLLKESLLEGATHAIQQRRELLKSLSSERRSLQQSRDVVSDVQDRLNVIHPCLTEKPDSAMRSDIDGRLVSLESECEQLLTRRQRHIDNRSGILLISDTTSFAEYLYADLNSRFPVLTAIAECLKTIRTCRLQNLQ